MGGGARSPARHLQAACGDRGAREGSRDADHRRIGTRRWHRVGNGARGGVVLEALGCRRGCGRAPAVDQGEVLGARSDQAPHATLDVRVLRRLLGGVRLAARAGARGEHLHPRDGACGGDHTIGQEAERADVHPRNRSIRLVFARHHRSARGRVHRARGPHLGSGCRVGGVRYRPVDRERGLARDGASHGLAQPVQSAAGIRARRLSRLQGAQHHATLGRRRGPRARVLAHELQVDHPARDRGRMARVRS